MISPVLLLLFLFVPLFFYSSLFPNFSDLHLLRISRAFLSFLHLSLVSQLRKIFFLSFLSFFLSLSTYPTSRSFFHSRIKMAQSSEESSTTRLSKIHRKDQRKEKKSGGLLPSLQDVEEDTRIKTMRRGESRRRRGLEQS